MSETNPRETLVLERGNYEARKKKVEFRIPAFLPSAVDKRSPKPVGVGVMNRERRITSHRGSS